MDEPNFDGAKEELAQRASDVLAVGDVVQEWRFKEDKSDRKVRGGYQWLDGDVIAVVPKPCGNVEWVALVQWCDGDKVLAWTAIASYQWRMTIMYRRKPVAEG